MSLRMMELVLPRAQADKLPELLGEKETHGIWTSVLDDDRATARILVSSDQTESISDLLAHRFGSADGFRLLLFAVEATLPAIEKPPEPEPADADAKPARTPERISREELYEDVSDAAKISPVYLATIILSTVVAAVGLIRDNVAVIIGAMVIALAAGSAGALAYTRGLSTSVIGVMVAVALLPPLVAAGLLLGAGQPALGLRALILLAINITCVNLAGVGTFLAQRVRPRTWWETKRAKRATRRAGASWLAMLLVLLVLIFFVSR